MSVEPDDLDGCAVDFTAAPTADDEIDGIVLFADVDLGDPAAVAARKAEWDALFPGATTGT